VVNPGSLIVNQPALALTIPSTGISAENPTPSTALTTIQKSPVLWCKGSFWDNNVGVSRPIGLGWQLVADASLNGTFDLRLVRESGGITSDTNTFIGPDRLSFGANPGVAGNVRISYGTVVISTRNNTGSTRNLITWGVAAANRLVVGTGSDITTIDGAASSTDSVYIFGNSVPIAIFGQGRVEWRAPDLLWGNTVVAPTLGQLNTTGSSQNMILRAQGSTAGNNNGGIHRARGGRTNGTGLMGGVSLELNADDSTVHVMAQVANVVGSNRVMSLCFGSLLTAVQMPANTGDRVIFIGDRNTAPSANAVGGHIYYSENGRPAWRFNGLNLRIDDVAATATAGSIPSPGDFFGFLSIDISGTTVKVPYFQN
jgi:hypothetical protein